MKLKNDFLLRRPILPLKINALLRDIIELSKIWNKVMKYKNYCELPFSYLNINEYSPERKIKNVLSRASYRTTVYGGLICYKYFKNVNEDAKIQDSYFKNKISFAKIDLWKENIIAINSLYDNYGNILILNDSENMIKIEDVHIAALCEFLNYKKNLTLMDLVFFLETNCCLTRDTSIEIINSLIEYDYFLVNILETYTNDKVLNKENKISNDCWIESSIEIDNFKNSQLFGKQDKNQFQNNLGAVLKCFQLIGLDNCLEHFYNFYNKGPVCFEILLKDIDFIRKLDQVKFGFNCENTIIKRIKKEICVALLNGEKEIHISAEKMNNDEIIDYEFDLFANVVDYNEIRYFNIDTGKYIVTEGDAQPFWEHQNAKVLKYKFNDETLNQIMNFQKNGLSTNFISDEVLDIKELFVIVENNKFCIINREGKKVEYSKGSLINDYYYPKKLISILKLSSLSNIPLPLNELILNLYKYYSPKVVIGNMILAREQWALYQLIDKVNSFEDFFKQLQQLCNEFKIPDVVSVCYTDVEALINIKNDEDLNFLYRLLKKKERVIIKENIQLYSPLQINGEYFANELIFHSSKIRTPKFFNVLCNKEIPRISSNMLEIRLTFDSKLINRVEVFNIVEKVIGNRNLFFVNYENQHYDELRIRLKNEDFSIGIHEFYIESHGLLHAAIVEYFPETIRYETITIPCFEQISIDDSLCIKDMILRSIDYESEKAIISVASTYSWLDIFFKDLSLKKIEFLNKYWFTRIDGSIYKAKEYEVFFAKINKAKLNNYIVDFNSARINVRNMNITNENFMDIIHMSNNRIIGIDIGFEHYIYKEVRTNIFAREV